MAKWARQLARLRKARSRTPQGVGDLVGLSAADLATLTQTLSGQLQQSSKAGQGLESVLGGAGQG
eukprot:5395427-Lingulodinium_polyedra.AAC.1